MALPDPPTLARLEHARIARALTSIASVAVPIAGGVMCRGEAGLWLNKAIGLGMSGPVSAAEIGAVIRFYEEGGIEPRVETCPLADDTLTRGLADAGFVVRRWAHVLVRSVANVARVAAPDGLRIEVVDPNDGGAVSAFAATAHAGFALDATPATEFQRGVWAKVARNPNAVAMRATVGGRAAGVGCVEVHGPHAALFAACVLPEFRRRGVQAELMAARLEMAAARGAEFALVASDPEGPTERNARRLGFAPAYTHAAMVRPGAGLVPVR